MEGCFELHLHKRRHEVLSPWKRRSQLWETRTLVDRHCLCCGITTARLHLRMAKRHDGLLPGVRFCKLRYEDFTDQGEDPADVCRTFAGENDIFVFPDVSGIVELKDAMRSSQLLKNCTFTTLPWIWIPIATSWETASPKQQKMIRSGLTHVCHGEVKQIAAPIRSRQLSEGPHAEHGSCDGIPRDLPFHMFVSTIARRLVCPMLVGGFHLHSSSDESFIAWLEAALPLLETVSSYVRHEWGEDRVLQWLRHFELRPGSVQPIEVVTMAIICGAVETTIAAVEPMLERVHSSERFSTRIASGSPIDVCICIHSLWSVADQFRCRWEPSDIAQPARDVNSVRPRELVLSREDGSNACTEESVVCREGGRDALCFAEELLRFSMAMVAVAIDRSCSEERSHLERFNSAAAKCKALGFLSDFVHPCVDGHLDDADTTALLDICRAAYDVGLYHPTACYRHSVLRASNLQVLAQMRGTCEDRGDRILSLLQCSLPGFMAQPTFFDVMHAQSDCIGSVAGLEIAEEFVTPDEESQVLQLLETASWETGRPTMQRRVLHFGRKFNYASRELESLPTDASTTIPPVLVAIGERLVSKGYMEQPPDQVTVNEYLCGQGIRPHVDDVRTIGPDLVSISLLEEWVMTLEHNDIKLHFDLPRRSALILRDAARYWWRHGISPRKVDYDMRDGARKQRVKRISLTFRTMVSGE